MATMPVLRVRLGTEEGFLEEGTRWHLALQSEHLIHEVSTHHGLTVSCSVQSVAGAGTETPPSPSRGKR